MGTGHETASRRPLIAVIGDGDASPEAYDIAEALGSALIDAGFRVLTGGGTGVMEAACRGARGSPRYTPGDTIAVLPGHDSGEANDFIDIALPTGLSHARNAICAQADAVIAVGGRAGTMSEICFAWILGRLIIAMRIPGWSGRMADETVDDRVRRPDIPEDRIYGADTPQDAVALLKQLLPRYR